LAQRLEQGGSSADQVAHLLVRRTESLPASVSVGVALAAREGPAHAWTRDRRW
jgi:hypothetical protein